MKFLPLLFLLTLPVLAQDPALPVKTETPAKYPPGTPGIVITIDEAFTTKHENKPPSVPFQISGPKNRDLRVLAGGKKTGAPELIRITLPSADGKHAAEILRFGALHLPAGTPAERIKAADALLKTTAYPMFTNGFENPKVLETYVTKIGKYDAVCQHIEMAEPGGTPVYLVKSVAILNPAGADGVVGFLMADKDRSEVKTMADLTSKGTGLQILHSVKFLPPP